MMHEPEPKRLPTIPAAEWLREVRHCESEAELFLAYDLARQGLDEYPDDAALKHRAVLCLASTGASERAAEEFRKLGLDKIAQHPPARMAPKLGFDIASLQARLLKDRAVATSGPERIPKLLEAAAAYEAIYRRMQDAGNPESYYPGINCATLHLLAGNTDAALTFARQVLAQLAAWPAEKKSYYEIATELEAHLIVGDHTAANAAAHRVAAVMRGRSEQDLRALATTIRQLRLLADAKHIDPDAAAALAPPRVIHFVGHIIGTERFPASQEDAITAQIAARLDRGDIGFAYGSLAAGADILFAEAILDRQIGLEIVLPFAVEEFVEVSVSPAGARWVERFWNCYNGAATVRFATEDRYLGDDSLFGYCSQLAMGRALLRARHLCAPVEQVAVWDGSAAVGAAGTAVDVAVWQTTGMPQTIIPVHGSPAAEAVPATRAPAPGASANRRSTRAMLFGDVKGFSKLTDEQLPRFVETVLGAFGRVVRRFADHALLVNTWGDGLFLVFGDAGKAADCALELQEAMGSIDLAAAGLPETMALRLGGHLGPVYAARDPILERENFFGAHVSRAARIEPVTPEKLVYVTETLAAVLALHNADSFDCSYVGMTKAAKDYGEMRMFLLRRRTST